MTRDASQAGSPYADLLRPPLSESDLQSSLVRAETLWSSLSVVRSTGSTNDDLRVAAKDGASHGTVLIAEEQVAGKGRLDRKWSAPPRSSLMFSMLLLCPPKPPSPWGWLPLAAAVALCDALERFEVSELQLKWPNDVLIGGRKVAGVLAELHAGAASESAGPQSSAVILGVGLNVSQAQSELPNGQATSLALVGATTDRAAIVRATLRAFEVRFQAWLDGEVGDLRRRYLEASATVGKSVVVELPGGTKIVGQASDVDHSGALVVMEGSTQHTIAAADVTHARMV